MQNLFLKDRDISLMISFSAIGLFKKHISFVSWNRITFIIYYWYSLALTILTSQIFIFYYYSFSLFSFELLSFCFIIRSYSSNASQFISADPFKSIQWVALDDNGFLKNSNESLQNKAAIYIYQFIEDPDKIYIGSSANVAQRFKQHRNLAKSRNFTSSKFYNSVRKYGWNNFRFGILEFIDLQPGADINVNRRLILEREQFYLDLFLPSLNVNKIAGSMLGFKLTEESRKKISLAMSGENNPSFKLKGENHPNLGNTHSEATRKKLSEIQKGRKLSDETRKKISEAIKGKYLSENSRQKISETMGTTIYLYTTDKKFIQSFTSSRAAATYLSCHKDTIMKYARSGKTFKDKYILSFKEL